MFRPIIMSVALPTLLFSSSSEATQADYVNHPKLLFTIDELPALRAKVADGGQDDDAFNFVLFQSLEYLSLGPDSLLSYLEGLSTLPELGLSHHMTNTTLSKSIADLLREANTGPLKQTSFAAKSREVIHHLADNHAVDNDDFMSSLRLRSLALGYDLTFEDASTPERRAIRDEIMEYLDYMPQTFEYTRYAYLPYANNRGVTVGAAMGLAVIAIWEDVPPHELGDLAIQLDFAHELVTKCLSEVLGEEGAYPEGILYAGWMLRMVIPYIEARKRFDGVDLATDPRLARIAEWMCYELLPEGSGRTNNLNDSLWSTRPLAVHSTYLDWAQTRYQSLLADYLQQHVTGDYGTDFGSLSDKVATALWDQDFTPVDPATIVPNSKIFKDRGIYFYRSAWKNANKGNELLLSFYSGPFRGGHAQEDQNHFTLYAYGDRYALDHGSQFITPEPKETVAHNVILIDQLGQHNAGSSIGTDGQIVESLLTDELDYVRADAGDAYSTYSPLNAAGSPFPDSDWSWGYDGGNPLLKADRTLVSIKGPETLPYFLLADDIAKDSSSHQYEWLFHTDKNNSVNAASNPVVINGSQSQLQLYFAESNFLPAIAFSITPFDHNGEDPNSTLLTASRTAVEPVFFVAMLPSMPSAQLPTFQSFPSKYSTVSNLTMDWGPVRDEAVFNPNRHGIMQALETDAKLAWVRTDEAGVVAYLLGDGDHLRSQGALLVNLGETGTAIMYGNTLHLSRQSVTFLAYGPNVTNVVGPSGPIYFERVGDFVSSDTVADGGVPSEVDLGEIVFHTVNPTYSGAHLRLSLSVRSHIELAIFDVRGRLIKQLAQGWYEPGIRRFHWDGADSGGRRQPTGAYWVRLRHRGRDLTQKLIVLR